MIMPISNALQKLRQSQTPSERTQTNPISNHQGQLTLWNDPSRFKVIVAGRRWGKTIYLREKLIQASETPESKVYYVGPTRGQAKDVMWLQLKNRIAELGWTGKANESELSFTRSNGSIIALKSAEKPGRIRGVGLKLVAMDEFAEYRSREIWDQVIRPCLSEPGVYGDAIFAMTPKGFNHGHEIYTSAKTDADWSAFSFRTIDSPFFQTPEGIKEIEAARANLSERDFRQEYEASFENFAGRLYYAFDREKLDIDQDYISGMPVIVGMDFNRSPMTAALMHLIDGKLVQFDEIFLQSSDTPEICREIKRRCPTSTITVRPDASGARTYSVNAKLSDHFILRENGFIIQARNKNPDRVDRWAAANRAFEKGYYLINCKKCPMTVRDFEVICYKEGACEPMLTNPMLGHIGDAATYAIEIEYPITGIISSGRYA